MQLPIDIKHLNGIHGSHIEYHKEKKRKEKVIIWQQHQIAQMHTEKSITANSVCTPEINNKEKKNNTEIK